MASWNDFFGNNQNTRVPAWMEVGSDSVASQVIRYDPPPQNYYYDHRYALAADPRVITMDLKVPICCEGCEDRVKDRLIDIEGVQSVKCDQAKQQVTVSGTASPAEVLAACKKLFKRSRWWEY